MIRNEHQYRNTLRQRHTLAESLDELLAAAEAPFDLASPAPDPVHDRDAFVRDLQITSVIGQLADLDVQLHEYERLRAGDMVTTAVRSLDDLPDALVRARVATGLSQKDLAARLGLKEQQIQRYEADRYASASLSRLREVIEALDIQFEGDLQLPTDDKPITRLHKRLRDMGFDRRVVDNRLLRDAGTTNVLAAAERVARLLALPLAELMSPTASTPALATTARFQAPRSASALHLDAYTRYAEGLADIVLRATAHLGPPAPPGSAQDLRTAIDQLAVSLFSDQLGPRDSERLLRATLQYCAQINVPILALHDPGAFHGACFTRSGRSVIVLKHTSDSPARWLALLIHEIDHLRDADNGELRTWIELGDIETWSDAPEEQHAHAFAADVLLYGRADAVLTRAGQAAGGSVERLKSIVPAIAAEAEVPPDVLANYLAFRLARRGIIWWPTAAGFQQHTNPWRAVNDQLIIQLDFAILDSVDRAALMDALGP